MDRLKEFFRTWHPKNVTGGAAIYPLLILFGLNLVDELDSQAFSVLSPNIREHFGLNLQGILTVVTLVGLTDILLGLPIGFYADRKRRTGIAAGGAAAWAGFSLLTGLAPNVFVMGIARAGSGLGKTVNSPTHNSLLSDYYSVAVRPNVYGFHRAASSIGQFIAPITAGLLAAAFSWRLPFVIFAFPTVVLVLLAFRLKEPVRGFQDRSAMGATGATLETEEAPPSYAESMRILWQVRTLRRIWYSIPFLAVSFVGFAALINLYLEEEFGVGAAQRGFLAAIDEPFQIAALLLGIPFATKLLARSPVRLLYFNGLILFVVAGCWTFLVLAPNVFLVTVARILVAMLLVVVAPAVLAALSLAIPAKVRAMGFAVTRLWVLPGLIVTPIIGVVADNFGIRTGLSLMIPIFVVGAIVILTSGAQINADIQKVRSSTTAMAEVRAARLAGQSKLLLVKDLDVSYDDVKVLFRVNFEVDEGEIIALLGTNGAGKSTLLKSISGLVQPGAGAIVYDGADLTHKPPNEIASLGIMQVPGGRGIFPTLTVAENFKSASWLYRRETKYIKEQTEKVLQFFPVLRDRWDTPAGNLSGGEQQMLTLGMAFIARPRLLMIDELSLGLAPVIVEQLLGIVKAIRDQGTTIILVEQSVNIALTIAGTAYFMEKGEIRFHGPTRDLLERPDMLRSVFLEGAGAMSEASTKRRARVAPRVRADLESRAVVLEVNGLSKAFGGVSAVDDVSFQLRHGEILGVIGPNGAGKTTVFDLLSGFILPDSGWIDFSGTDVTLLPADMRARLGLGRSFQDARLFPALTVAETIALALERRVEVKDPVASALQLPVSQESERNVARRVDELIDLMGLQAFRDKFVAELSTGSRRIVDLACVLAHEPTVLLFDEPSSGIAQRETEALGPLLLRIREATDASLLVIEHDMPLVTSIADEIVALDLGRVVTRGIPKEVVRHPNVVASYLGTNIETIARSGTLGTNGKRASAKNGRARNGRAGVRKPRVRR